MSSAPIRRSRRTRGERPEIIPPKSDEEPEMDDDGGYLDPNTGNVIALGVIRGKRKRRATPTVTGVTSVHKSKEKGTPASRSGRVGTSRKRARVKSDTESTQNPSVSGSNSDGENDGDDTGDDNRDEGSTMGGEQNSGGTNDIQPDNDDYDEDMDDTQKESSKRGSKTTMSDYPNHRGRSRRAAVEDENEVDTEIPRDSPSLDSVNNNMGGKSMMHATRKRKQATRKTNSGVVAARSKREVPNRVDYQNTESGNKDSLSQQNKASNKKPYRSQEPQKDKAQLAENDKNKMFVIETVGTTLGSSENPTPPTDPPARHDDETNSHTGMSIASLPQRPESDHEVLLHSQGTGDILKRGEDFVDTIRPAGHPMKDLDKVMPKKGDIESPLRNENDEACEESTDLHGKVDQLQQLSKNCDNLPLARQALVEGPQKDQSIVASGEQHDSLSAKRQALVEESQKNQSIVGTRGQNGSSSTSLIRGGKK